MSSERPVTRDLPPWIEWVIGLSVLAALVWLLYPYLTVPDPASGPPAASSPPAESQAARFPVGAPEGDAERGTAARQQPPYDTLEDLCENHIGYCARAVLGDVPRNAERITEVADWLEVVCPGGVIDDVVLCPSRGGDPLPHYTLNAAVAGRRLDEITSPETTVMLYEVDRRGMPVFPHRGGAMYAFVDGHVEWRHERDRPLGIRNSEPTTEARHTRRGGLSSRESREACNSNLRQLSLAHLMYMQDYNGMPPHDNWSECVFPYVKREETLRCPADQTDARLSYDLNPDVAGVHRVHVERPACTFLLYEVDESGHLVFRHDGGANYAFMDGHVRWYQNTPEESEVFAREEARR